jgi:1-acyl-sn-glycerol-3-phosphate acyltransferase
VAPGINCSIVSLVYFERLTLIHPERLPRTGPVLYLGLHRNGAVDGFVSDQALHHPVFMISTQLRKNWFTRLFFEGIAVTRTKDEGDRTLNDAALHQCLGHLRAAGELFVFPEGTSSLGPRHLPFKS